ncbi:NAD-dependent epimerase/dehydratase family protein [Mariniblastus fucicola]|uniref:3 beta-hydroxysteroid dehydrogenase/Delta 5-->4-isomerase n=1 Tax=Mariniblastus fucicola TaxID=980251 RepID=A0A5B9PJX3_9BACT|nr:NAD-dependent epimerase/dehydratase family protein [Mariniblastus fucicola]QEG22951.1 3 beta-hydroxysteroid dehydrogenase/Delta 5-->4-isomerase [Mariniblastus fucicola]
MVVGEQLLTLAHESLGQTPKRILVTGATGFVGSRVAQVLVEAGHDVTITGRSKYRIRSGGKWRKADLTSKEEVFEICEGQQIVIHSGALTSPWGSLETHRRVNVAGTQNVLDACRKFDVDRLVHVSSTAIFFQFRDRDRVTDRTEFPREFCCPYAQSKAESEKLVSDAMAAGLNAYIVRARAVFGPGDNALLPRLIAASKAGRLRQIGNGENLCDLTYIDNLVAGLILAARPTAPNGVCTITNEDPVRLWDVLKNVLLETTGKFPTKKVPYWLALRAAHWAELKHRVLRTPGEPPITRYGVGLLAKQQTFVSEAAKRDLRYQPLVPLKEGIRRTVSDLRRRHESPDANQASVEVSFFSTGYVEFKRNIAERGASGDLTRFHATVALIKHPIHGLTLFDTGYSKDFFEATARMPYRLYRMATKVVTHEQWSIENWLKRAGIEPDDIRRIIISHFHADHIGALRRFPNAELIASQKAWQFAKIRKGFGAVKRGILPDLIPPDCDQRLHTINEMHDPGLGPIAKCKDLFNDGSVRLFDLDGHADGQMGALLNLDGSQCFLLADTFWSRTEIQARRAPTFAYRMIADNYKAALASRKSIFEIHETDPEIEFVCAHCPEFAREQRFDALLEQVRE